MSYTINLSTGCVYRNSDNVQVAPCDSTTDPNYVEYVNWINAGNSPTEVTVPDNDNLGTKITVLAFRNRFTVNEKIMMDLASIDDPTKTMNERQISAAIRVILRDCDCASFIDLSRPDIVSGLELMKSVGILTPERANEILTKPVSLVEIPTE
jgi:hypothetical protein